MLPGNNEVNPSTSCQITAAELASQFTVQPNDTAGDTAGLQAPIDTIRTQCSPSAKYSKRSLITLPTGGLKVSKELHAYTDYLIIKGAATDTGMVRKGYGEGVYLGSANSNRACHGNTSDVDRPVRVQVLDNRIGPCIAAESIDVKPCPQPWSHRWRATSASTTNS